MKLNKRITLRTIKMYFSSFLVLYLFLGVITISQASQNEIIFSTSKPKGDSGLRFLKMVYTEAFNRMGEIFICNHYPSKRSSLLANLGKSDGELSRIHSYNKTFTNLVRVEEPHWNSGFIAVAANSSITVNGWDSLKNTNYRVNYEREIVGCERNLPKVVVPVNLERVNSAVQGFRQLLKGRCDILISSEVTVISTLEYDEFKDSNLYIIGVMEEFSSHLFLHKKHRELAPRLSTILKDMKKENLLDRYWNEIGLKRYLKK